MTAKLFSLRPSDGPPSTQFASTQVALPDPGTAAVAARGAEAPNPDTLSPDSLVITGSGSNPAVPDVVTDIGGLPGEVADPADAPTLSHIGRYALKRHLGSGGLGAVFEAWDPLLSRAVAIKTLQFDAADGDRPSLDGLFLNEARAAAGLNHRYIVTIHDAGLSPHGVYIAMERLYGRDLRQALAAGWRPGVEQAVQLVRRVADALAYAHARGVIHCDIKPANVFLQRKDRPKVLDFGIARILHAKATPALAGAVVGSPRYRAPEQLDGGAVDARTDLFSLGAVFYELLTGRRAFEGETLEQINQAVLAGPPRPALEVNRNVPRELSAVAARLLARDPADRFTCATELGAELRRWSVELHARRDAAAAAAHRPPARHRQPAGWVLAGVAALGVAGLLAAWGTARRTDSPGTPAAAAAAPETAPIPAAPPATGLGGAVPPGIAGAPGQAAADAPDASPPPPAAALVSGPTGTPAAATGPASPMSSRPETAPAGARAAPAGATLPRARPAEPVARGRASLPAESAAARDRDDAAAVQAPSASPPSGVLHLAVSPWGEIDVDGTPRGTTPPLTKLTLPEGLHTITLRNADFPPMTVQIQVHGDRPVTLRHRFGS